MKSNQRLEHTFNEALITGEQSIYLAGLAEMLNRIGAFMRHTLISNRKELNAYLKKKRNPDLIFIVSPLLSNTTSSLLNRYYDSKNQCHFVLMAEDHELPLVISYVKEGVKAALSKSCAEMEIIKALNHVYRKSFYFSPAFSESVINRGLNSLSVMGKTRLLQISEREKEIIRLMWNDYTNKEIAEMLHVSMRTVESHRKNIYDKLNVKTLGGIFKFGLDNGIIS